MCSARAPEFLWICSSSPFFAHFHWELLIQLSKFFYFSVILCILILSEFFIYQPMHKRIALKRILKSTLKQLLLVLVQSPSSGSTLFELAKVIVVKIIS
jgi:hypothetical protein